MANLRRLASQQQAAKTRAKEVAQQKVAQQASAKQESLSNIDAAVEKHGDAGHHEHVLHTSMMALNNAATQLRMNEFRETKDVAASRGITDIDHHLHQAQLNLDEHRAARRQGDIDTAAKWMRQSANHIITASRAISKMSGAPRFTEQTAGLGDAMHSHEHVERLVDGLANHFATKVAGAKSGDVLLKGPRGKLTPRDPREAPQDFEEQTSIGARQGAIFGVSRSTRLGRTEPHVLGGQQLSSYRKKAVEMGRNPDRSFAMEQLEDPSKKWPKIS